MSKRVLCKFFAHGACLKGDHCDFSHDWNAPANNVCTFYQKGVCTYGSRCRYDHVKASQTQFSNGSSSANSSQSAISDSVTATRPFGTTSGVSRTVPRLPTAASDLSVSSKTYSSPEKVAWDRNSGMQSVTNVNDIVDPNSLDPLDQPICSFAAAGNCPRGENCPHLHGDLCSFCGKHCLHPLRTQEREEHLAACQIKQKQLDALKHSQEIECSVCLERVLSKPTAAERKFGLLSECDHPFCISCIRNWRSSSPSSGMDVNSTLRACPICRQLSFFVIPSVIWYSSQDEKLEIVDNYKAKLRSIDCKHFDFGNGTCPFGTSCFYKHKVKPRSCMWNRCHVPGVSFDEALESVHLLFDNLYEPHQAIGLEEMENYGYEVTESEDYGELDYDDYTDIGAEMFRQMMEDIDEDGEDEESFGDYLADRYCLMEMQAFLSSLSSDQD